MRLFIVLVLFFSFSCATDAPQDENNTRTDPNGCVNPCSAGETRCDNTIVEACAADNKGCFNWVVGIDCAADSLLCDDSANPAICLSEPGTCDDGEKNQDESDIDCGGQRCEACELGKTCNVAADCDSENCDSGGTLMCVTPDTPTCSDNKKNQDESDVDCGGSSCEKCAKDEACTQNEDCDSNTCDNGTCADMETSCNQDDKKCVGNTVQVCDTNQWVETQICAQMCDQGACSDDVACTAGENRCFKNSVQKCNVTGSAWQHLSICNDDCDQGLCVGACEPNSFRCNVDKKEVCNADGATWSEEEVCANGCAQETCIEDGLVNQGVPQTLSGVHVYSGCVKIELGGELTIPADETLEIYAKCLEVTSSSSITLEANARFIFNARETVLNEGTITGGDFVKVSAYLDFTNKGDISSELVQLRGDNLINEAGASISGTVAQALYGSSWTNDGTHDGDVSVMPPVEVGSPTHPKGFWWNLNGDDVSVSWDKPFQSVSGYYVSVNGTEAPTPANSEFTTAENFTFPLGRFRRGENTIQVVSVNGDSTVGTISEPIIINFNTITPPLLSSSHPDPTTWTTSDDVFIEWDETFLNDTRDSFTGYWYAWNHEGDTVPDSQNGTFRNDTKLLLNDQAPGVWSFHLSLIDRFGRISPYPSHFQVRVGAEPAFGNVAGKITDSNGDPIFGARVKINDGLFSASTETSGDYTFNKTIPSAAFDYTVEVSAPGFLPASQVVRLGADQVEIKNFQLQSDPNPVNYKMDFEIDVAIRTNANQVPTNVKIGHDLQDIFSWGYGIGVTPIDGGGLTQSRRMNPRTNYHAPSIGFNGTHYYATYVEDSSNSPVVSIWKAGQAPTFRRYSQFFGRVNELGWNGTDYNLFSFYSGTSISFGTTDDTLDSSIAPSTDVELGDAGIFVNSSTPLKMIWDGTSYALLVIGRTNPGENGTYFVKVSRDGSIIQAPVLVFETQTISAVALAFDGEKYYFSALVSNPNLQQRYSVEIASIDSAGSVNGPVEIFRSSSARSYQRHMDLAFDGRNLIAAYVQDNQGKFATIDRNTLKVVPASVIELGEATNLSIDYSFKADRGAIVYTDLTGRKLRHRSFYVK